jgi:hypothetical protein
MALLFACEKKQNESTDIEYIDINSPEKINFTDLFKEYHLIFPETNDSSLFGLEIQRIERFKDKIYLLNQKQSGKNILCFDINGRFLFAIDRMGYGPGEYTYLENFFIDTKYNKIILVCENTTWFYFDLDGNFL